MLRTFFFLAPENHWPAFGWVFAPLGEAAEMPHGSQERAGGGDGDAVAVGFAQRQQAFTCTPRRAFRGHPRFEKRSDIGIFSKMRGVAETQGPAHPSSTGEEMHPRVFGTSPQNATDPPPSILVGLDSGGECCSADLAGSQ